MPRSVAAGSIGTRAAEFSQRLRMEPRAVVRKTAEDNPLHNGCSNQRVYSPPDCDVCCAIGRKTIDAGGDRGKGNRSKAVGLAQFDGAAIAGRQRLIFALAAAVPDRTDGMDHMPGRQPIPPGDLGIAGLAAIERAAFGK
jgi:hypothetical protein